MLNLKFWIPVVLGLYYRDLTQRVIFSGSRPQNPDVDALGYPDFGASWISANMKRSWDKHPFSGRRHRSESGSIQFTYALESGSPRIQKLVKKHLKFDKFESSLAYLLTKNVMFEYMADGERLHNALEIQKQHLTEKEIVYKYRTYFQNSKIDSLAYIESLARPRDYPEVKAELK